MSRLYLGTRKGLFILERHSDGWRLAHKAFLGDPVSMVLPDPRDGTLYAALNLGHFGVKLHRSTDGGVNWEEITAPAYPPQPEGADGPEWNLQQIWSLETGSAFEAGVLWCGTLPGGLFRSEDGGQTWEVNRPLWDRPDRPAWFGGGYDVPGIHSICVDPRDGRRVTVAVSCAGTWQTDDGGDHWRQCAHGMRSAYMPLERAYEPDVQDPHRMVQCYAHPERFWVQHHNGIFRSDDGAHSWQELTEIPPSAFGFAVAVHPTDPDTAWFVPAVKDECRVPVGGALIVNRTRDGGRTWEALREGLPQQQCYDLVYRHGLDIDPSGETLAFGSTTGSLWISEDAGASWTHFSAHLPPISVVRFDRRG